jgi:hypothetical protein
MQTRKKRKIPQTCHHTKPSKSGKIHSTTNNNRQPYSNRTCRSRSPTASRPRRLITRRGRHKNGRLKRNNMETSSKRKKKSSPSHHRRKIPDSHHLNRTKTKKPATSIVQHFNIKRIKSAVTATPTKFKLGVLVFLSGEKNV